MSAELIINKTIYINATPSEVWDALINPEKISQYFPGAETITDWQIGSEILFIHTYEGKAFTNKGIVLTIDTNRLLRYTYWTAFSNTEDKSENYTLITYALTVMNDQTKLTLTQTNFKSEEWFHGLETG